MSEKIKYSDEPIGEPKVVADFLQLPDQLAFRDERVKVLRSTSFKLDNGKRKWTTVKRWSQKLTISKLLRSLIAL